MKFIILIPFLVVSLFATASKKSIFSEYKAGPYISWDKKSAFITEEFPEPFWRSKPATTKKIKENRLVPVSVKTQTSEKKNGFKKMQMISGAVANVPMQEVYDFALDYNNYGKVSVYVKEFKYYPKKKLIYAFTSAFNYSEEFLVQTYETPFESDSSTRQLQWRVVGGAFAGMKVLIDFNDIGSRKTEIVMRAFFKYKKMPLPEIFLEFGLEVVLQKASERLRSLVEEHYSQTVSKPNSHS